MLAVSFASVSPDSNASTSDIAMIAMSHCAGVNDHGSPNPGQYRANRIASPV